jgi:hypothetical protein
MWAVIPLPPLIKLDRFEGADVETVFQAMGCEGVVERVTIGAPCDALLLNGGADRY